LVIDTVAGCFATFPVITSRKIPSRGKLGSEDGVVTSNLDDDAFGLVRSP